MSFTTVSSLNFDDTNSNTWNLEFEVWNASSNSSTFRVLSGVRTTGSPEEHPLNPILAAKLDTAIYDDSRTIHGYINDDGNDLTDIRITIKKNSTIWHRGLLQETSGGDQVSLDNPRLQLSWNDGLEFLKSKSWDVEGRGTLLETLWYLLTDQTRTGLTTRVAIAWEDANASTTNGRSRALQHDFDRQLGQGTYWDALVQILRKYNLQLFQEDGRWYCLHRSYRDPNQSYAWEERDSGGSESTGTTDPTVSLGTTDWFEKPKENDRLRRPFVKAHGWRESYTLSGRDWLNKSFVTDVTDPIDGSTIPSGWYLTDSVTFDTAGNEISMAAGTEGINQSNTQYAEQVFDKRLNNTQGGESDTVGVTINGSADINTDTESTNDIVIAELVARNGNGNEYTWDQSTSSWTTGQTYITAQVVNPGTGTQNDSFSVVINEIPSPDHSGSSDDTFYVTLRLLCEADPDGDTFEEVKTVYWESAEIRTFKTHPDRDVDDGVTTNMTVGGNTQSESVTIGSDQKAHPAGGIRYDTGNATPDKWRILHSGSSGMDHTSRAVSTSVLETARLHDRHRMMSQKLFRLLGQQDRGTLSMRNTAEYKSRDWLPHYRKENILDSKVRIGLIELRDDGEGTVNQVSGVDNTSSIDTVTGLGSTQTSTGGADVASTTAAKSAAASGSATQLSDLVDVSSAEQSDGNVLASGGSEYRQEAITGVTNNHVKLENLSDVGSSGVGSSQIQTDAVTPTELDRSQTYTWNANQGFGGEGSPAYDIESSGDIAANGTLRDLSDARVKEIIGPIDSPLARIAEVSGFFYERTDQDYEGRQAGLIAQHVEKVFPEAVDEKGDRKTLDVGATIGLAFSAINALRKENEHLKQKVETLEDKI